MTYLLIVLAVLVIWVIFTYNRLVTLRFRVGEATSDIDVQSKRRFDLIPNLVETVKGYMAHEKGVLENVTAARAGIMQSGAASPLDKAKAEDTLSGTLKTLFAVAENYPELKANENFLKLQDELSDTENKMQAARRFYNGNVRDMNTAVSTFPSNLIAGPFGFQPLKFFEVANETEKQAVQVKF